MDRDNKLSAIIEKTDKGCSLYYGVLPSLIRERGYHSGIEIGVLFGGHAKAMLDSDSLLKLVGIDPFKTYEQSIEGLESQDDYDLAYELTMKRLPPERYLHLRTTSDEAFNVLKTMRCLFDFVFIDGLHTYDQVQIDLLNYDTLIRKGGVIACHDYNHPNFPLVTVAIDEFAKDHSAEIVICPFHAIYMNKTW